MPHNSRQRPPAAGREYPDQGYLLVGIRLRVEGEVKDKKKGERSASDWEQRLWCFDDVDFVFSDCQKGGATGKVVHTVWEPCQK